MELIIRVTNKKYGGKGEYIGRPSPLGNPFYMESEEYREIVIRKYRNWLNEKIEEKDKSVIEELKRLQEKAYANEGKLELTCWCSPKKCHGDIIAEVIKSKVF